MTDFLLNVSRTRRDMLQFTLVGHTDWAEVYILAVYTSPLKILVREGLSLVVRRQQQQSVRRCSTLHTWKSATET